MDKTILQYQISDWSQLSNCRSNNSPLLNISVSKFMNNRDITGTRVCVNHEIYGTLFAYTIFPRGDLVTNDVSFRTEDVMTSDILLNELARYGFYVDYQEEYHLSTGLVNLLKTIQGLNYDKIRVISVHVDDDIKNNKVYITAFNVRENEYWINSGYSPSEKEWNEAILSGTAINISGLQDGKNYDWSWLYNSVQDIDQILLRYDEDESQ